MCVCVWWGLQFYYIIFCPARADKTYLIILCYSVTKIGVGWAAVVGPECTIPVDGDLSHRQTESSLWRCLLNRDVMEGIQQQPNQHHETGRGAGVPED